MTVEFDESGLILAAQSGDLQAFSQLVDRHQVAIRAFFAVRTGNPHDAEDLAQDVFLTAWNKIGDFLPEKPLGPWLRGIAFNLLLNHRRKMKAEPIGAGSEIEHMLNASIDEREGDADDFIAALRSCMQTLKDEDREIMQRRYFKGLSVTEIAAEIGKKHSAMTMHLHRLRVTLRECITWRLNQS